MLTVLMQPNECAAYVHTSAGNEKLATVSPAKNRCPQRTAEQPVSAAHALGGGNGTSGLSYSMQRNAREGFLHCEARYVRYSGAATFNAGVASSSLASESERTVQTNISSAIAFRHGSCEATKTVFIRRYLRRQSLPRFRG